MRVAIPTPSVANDKTITGIIYLNFRSLYVNFTRSLSRALGGESSHMVSFNEFVRIKSVESSIAYSDTTSGDPRMRVREMYKLSVYVSCMHISS